MQNGLDCLLTVLFQQILNNLIFYIEFKLKNEKTQYLHNGFCKLLSAAHTFTMLSANEIRVTGISLLRIR